MPAAKLRLHTALLGAVIALCPITASADPGIDGANGPTIASDSGPFTSSGENGTDGSGADNAGDGGAGGSITTTVSTGSLNASSTGGEGGHAQFEGSGQGGNGGDGGDIHVTVDGTVSNVTLESQGGSGGIASADTVPTAQGGDGGAITVVVDGTVTGAVSANTVGGRTSGSGNGDTTVPGGAGGAVTVVISGAVESGVYVSSSGGDSDEAGGRGGDISVTISGAVDAVTAESRGGRSSHWPMDGEGGDVVVKVTGTVDGRLMATTTDGGTVSVVLAGGQANGEIVASGGDSRTLTFDFVVGSPTELERVTAALSQQAASGGSVTIDGHPYRWTDFSALVNLLRTAAPDATIVLSVSTSSAAADAAPVGGTASTGPVAATCGSSPFRSVRLGDGTIAVFQHRRDGDALVGQVTGGVFRNAEAGAGWSVTTGPGGQLDISDASGATVANCSFG